MNRYERGVWFEKLCELRARHREHGSDDRQTVMTIEEAIAYAELMLAQEVVETADQATDASPSA